MSAMMATFIGVSFVLIMFFVIWLKYHEHLHLHRLDRGPHSNRTDLRHILYYLSESGVFRWRRPEKPNRSREAAKL